jgi:cell wall-associated NlpC family hydrolase
MKKKWLQKACIMNMVGVMMFSSTAYAETVGTVTADVLNIRSQPSLSSQILSKTYYGNQVSILGKEGDWYKIKISNNENAYVFSDYINEAATPTATITTMAETTSAPITQVEYGRVNASILNLRESNSLSSAIIGKLSQYESVTILGTEGDWFKVQTSSNQVGYTYRTYITKYDPSAVSDTTSVRNQIVEYAKQFLGNPYVYGGTSLTNGVDCSSFTQQILGQFGYRINRTSATQYNNGRRISANELLPGDLVFYGYSGVISHVGLYIGDGKIIHASDPSRGILISGLYTQGKKPYIGSVRVVE